MSFTHRETFYQAGQGVHLPGRLYVHEGGFDKVFGGKVKVAQNYFAQIVVPAIKIGFSRKVIPGDAQYMIATAWGDTQNRRRADLFFYSGFNGNWKSNSEVTAFPLAEDRDVLHTGSVACEDITIMLGREAELRRRTENLTHFLEANVPIRDLPWKNH